MGPRFMAPFVLESWLFCSVSSSYTWHPFVHWLFMFSLFESSWPDLATYYFLPRLCLPQTAHQMHTFCSFNEWATTCFWLQTVFPRSHISILQASRSLVTAISPSHALAFLEFVIFFRNVLCIPLKRISLRYTSASSTSFLTTSS